MTACHSCHRVPAGSASGRPHVRLVCEPVGPAAAVDSLATEVVERPSRAERVPLTVVCGPRGSELRARADEITDRLAEHAQQDGRRVVTVSLWVTDPASEFDLMSRLPSLSALRGNPGTLLFLKNADQLPVDALATLEALIRQLAGTATHCVCSIGLPLPRETGPALRATFERLRRDGLARLVVLRPAPRRRLPEIVTSLIGALPEPALCAALWTMTRGWPRLMATALRMGRDEDLMTVVDRHAYLTAWRNQFRVPANDELLNDIRELGPTAWGTAKAIATFGPLGPAAPRLVGEALGLTEQEARDVLAGLVDAGVLQYLRASSSWRFRVPLIGLSLRSAGGPFELRRLAQIAVTALWQGTARCDFDHYLPDQLVNAGRLVDPSRAREELLASAERVAVHHPQQSLTWLRAAADLTADRSERAQILLMHARTCLLSGVPRPALESTCAVLSTYAEEVADGKLADVYFTHLTALHESGDIATLDQVARGEWWPWPGRPLERAVGRAVAMALLGRWQQARELLAEIRRDPEASTVEHYVRRISTIAGLWLGDSTEFDHAVLGLIDRIKAGEKPSHRELRTRIGALVTLGELRRADGLLSLSDRMYIRPTTACQVALEVAAGRATEALELTRKSIATGPRNGCDADQTAMFYLAATVHQYQGKLSQAVELIASAHERTPTLPHLLAVATARAQRLSGQDPAARRTLETALREAEEAGLVALTDLLWISLADIVAVHDEWHLLPGYLEQIEKVARRMGTEQAEINRLIVHAAVHADRDSAGRAAALLRERDQPLELAGGLERLVRFRVAAPQLLLEAYAAAGAIDALMCRGWQRNLMRAHGVPVPGRQETKAENERLLAVLVADGLSNKQVAALLGTSEKSVEGRLTRMFGRTGYRSRVELVSAMLTGRFPG